MIVPAVRALMKREGLEPNYGQLEPKGEDQWMLSSWTADLDYDVFLDRYPGGGHSLGMPVLTTRYTWSAIGKCRSRIGKSRWSKP